MLRSGQVVCGYFLLTIRIGVLGFTPSRRGDVKRKG
jgi:hypothetical protein